MAQTVWVPLPSTRQLRELLETQLRRDVRLSPHQPLAPATRGLSFAIYVDSRLATRAVVVADLPAAAYIGAAPDLVPVGVAESAVTAHELPPLIAQGFREVLGEWAVLFDAADEPGQTRLYSTVLPGGGEPPRDILALSAAPGLRLDLAVLVRAYGQGRLSLVLGR